LDYTYAATGPVYRARSPAFAATWRTFVVRLHELGEEFVELRGDEVD